MGLLLSLHPTISRTASQRLNFSFTNEVEISINCMLQCRSSYSELKCLSLGWLGEEAVDETT